MQQRQLGPFTVSAIGLGCMNVSAGYGPRIPEDEAGALFNAALDAGYSFLVDRRRRKPDLRRPPRGARANL